MVQEAASSWSSRAAPSRRLPPSSCSSSGDVLGDAGEHEKAAAATYARALSVSGGESEEGARLPRATFRTTNRAGTPTSPPSSRRPRLPRGRTRRRGSSCAPRGSRRGSPLLISRRCSRAPTTADPTDKQAAASFEADPGRRGSRSRDPRGAAAPLRARWPLRPGAGPGSVSLRCPLGDAPSEPRARRAALRGDARERPRQRRGLRVAARSLGQQARRLGACREACREDRRQQLELAVHGRPGRLGAVAAGRQPDAGARMVREAVGHRARSPQPAGVRGADRREARRRPGVPDGGAARETRPRTPRLRPSRRSRLR